MSNSRAMIRAKSAAMRTAEQSRQTEPIVIEVTKARRLEYAAVPDLTIHFRKLAEHTSVGSAEDEAQEEKFRVEAAEMAFAIKETAPTVTWDWLCKILSDEYTRTIAESERNLGKVRRNYGARGQSVPDIVKRKLTR